MIKNYIVTAFRSFKKNKLFTGLNFVGLVSSLTIFLLIISFVLHEQSFDSFHKNADNIYRLARTNTSAEGGAKTVITSLPPALGPSLKADFSGVKDFVRFRTRPRVNISRPDLDSTFAFIEEKLMYTDASVLTMFSFELTKGNPNEVLKGARKIVLSERMANKYFGSTEPVGKTLVLDNVEAVVSGVMKNLPSNSSIQFDFLVSLETYPLQLSERFRRDLDTDWNSFSMHTFVLVDNEKSFQQTLELLPAYVKSRSRLASSRNFEVNIAEPITSTYLNSVAEVNYLGTKGNPRLLIIISIVAILILIVAAFNFMNLSTALYTTRAKEVGVRKAAGAMRWQVGFQFLTEAVLLMLFSLPVALILTYLLIPYYNTLMDYNLSLSFINTWQLWTGPVLLFLVLGLISGSYPAVFLSRFNPATVLKGRMQFSTMGEGAFFRKSLTVFQFFISTGLIFGSFFIQRQVDFLQSAAFSIENERIINLNLFRFPLSDIQSLKHKLQELSSVEYASVSLNIPYHEAIVAGETNENIQEYTVDQDYLETYGLNIIEGRDFSQEFAQSDLNSNAVILNEQAVRMVGIEKPVGEKILVGQNIYTIVGIVEDFHFESVYDPIRPMMLKFDPFTSSAPAYISLKINNKNKDVRETIKQVRSIWHEFTPRAMEFSFLDDIYNSLYKMESRLSIMFWYFSMFSVFIACLGIFGLSGYMAQQRTKELGIRKVFGASTASLIKLLSKDYAVLILIANLVALPVTYVTVQEWLQNFAYQAEADWIQIALVSLLPIFLGSLVILYQSVRTSLANPVESLRSD